MIRVLVGIVVGYVVMAVLVTVLLFGAFLAMGVDVFFKTDSYEVSTLSLWISGVVGFGSAIAGGYVCAAISRSLTVCKVLALITVIVAIVLCLPKLHEDPVVRAGDVPMPQVMSLAQTPIWMKVLTPALGVLGIVLGARMRLRM